MGQPQWDRDPANGDYVMALGSPVNTESLTVPAFIRCKTKRGGWLYAPDAQYGSRIDLVAKSGGSKAAASAEIEHTLASALQPMIDDGRAARIDVTLTQMSRSGELVDIVIIDQQGQPDTLTFRPVGG